VIRRWETLEPRDIATLAEAVAAELTELPATRVRAAVEQAIAHLAGEGLGVDLTALLDLLVDSPTDEAAAVAVNSVETELRDAGEWEQLVDVYLARVATAEDSPTRSAHLAALGDLLEHDLAEPERALSATIEAFREAPVAALVEPLMRRAAAAGRWNDLARCLFEGVAAAVVQDRVSILRALATIHADHIDEPDAEIRCLEQLRDAAVPDPAVLVKLAHRYDKAGRVRDRLSVLTELADATEDISQRATLYREMAGECERIGDFERAAEFHEWVLSCESDEDAFRCLERIYTGEGRWHAAINVYCRHAEIVAAPARGELYTAIARIYETKLEDLGSAIDFYTKVDSADPGRADIVSTIARLDVESGRFEDAIDALEGCARLAESDGERSDLLHRAATIATDIDEADRAERLLLAAFRASPTRKITIKLGRIAREHGDLSRAETLLARALNETDAAAERAALSCDLAELRDASGDSAGAIARYRDAIAIDENVPGAHAALADLYAREQQLEPLVSELRVLARHATSRDEERTSLDRIVRAATALGDMAEVQHALERIIEIDPQDTGAHLQLSTLLMSNEAWRRAREVLTLTLARFETSMAVVDCVDAHYRLGRCEMASGEQDRARIHLDTALALDAHHRPSLLARIDMDADDPQRLVSHKLALVASSPTNERAGLLAEIGDVYANVLHDSVTAREMYRDALSYRPTDHLLLNKCLGLVVEHNDWTQSADMLERLIETEDDARVRAKYRHVGASVLRKQLDRVDDAADMLRAALADDPTSTRIALALESILKEQGDNDALALYYYERVDALQNLPGTNNERVRAWTELGDVCLTLERRDDALCAFEVAASLDSGNVARRARLANLYFNTGPDYYAKAIEQHQGILREHRGRIASYHALRGLYRLTSQPAAERACADAIAALGIRDDSPVAPAPPLRFDKVTPSFDAEMWTRITNEDVDRMLSILFAMAAPVNARRHALSPQQLGLKRKHAVTNTDGRPFARLLRWVAGRIGVELQDVYVRPEQNTACRVALCQDDRGIVPVVILGRAVLEENIDHRALAFSFARRLCDLRPDRIARLVFRNASELTQIVRAAVAIADGAATGATAESLATMLSPLDLDQVKGIGERLGERHIEPQLACLQWLDATDRGGARVGFAVGGDLRACIGLLDAEPGSQMSRSDRVIDLAWSSITADVLDVRQRLEPGDRADTEPAVVVAPTLRQTL